MIELINLTKRFKGLRAVDNISLNVGGGVIFGFLGPNGAGKTTTLRMMAGTLQPSEGRIMINNMDMSKHPEEIKRITGFIPDRPFIYEKLTGFEFLCFMGGLYGLKGATELKKRIMLLLETFELDHWSDELVESYSHGMKQRLVMCSALLHDPRVLIVDEPMVGLDPRGARLVKDIFKNEAQKGKTIFVSTHSLDIAQEICNEVAIIQSGKITAIGSPEELKNQAGVDGNLENVFLKLTEGAMLAHEKSLSAS
ncbi:MAG: ABC transporter ATP-binding protein [Deltaproteobacteria bacterium]|nr:ABC transporter ATP-binding protein [Deltaproteobacteria bacterium]